MIGADTNRIATGAPVQRAQVENLYVEAMLLADEAHAAFAAERDLGSVRGNAAAQIGLACESLKTTTRLMHVIAWLLHRRAMFAGDPGAGPNDSAARIGAPVAADWDVCAGVAREHRAAVEQPGDDVHQPRRRLQRFAG